MKTIFRVAVALLAIAANRCFPENHGFAVLDSIQMSRFSDPPAWYPQAEFKFAPDKKHFLVVTSKGRVDTDMTESSLWVFDSAEVQRFIDDPHAKYPPAPHLLVRLTATPIAYSLVPYAPVLSSACWSRDSQSVFYLGEAPNGNRRLYKVSMGGGQSLPLTPLNSDVRQFDAAMRGIVYTASAQEQSSTTDQFSNRRFGKDVRVLTGLSLPAILFPGEANGIKSSPQLWSVRNGRAQLVPSSGSSQGRQQIGNDGGILSISPDGRFVIRLQPAAQVPARWSHYLPAIGFESRAIHPGDNRLTSPSNPFGLRQYALVDLTTGNSTPLIEAPVASTLAYPDRDLAVWSPNGLQALLTNTFLPFQTSESRGKTAPVYPCVAAIVDVASHRTECLRFAQSNETTTHDVSPAPMRLEDAIYETDDEVALRFSAGNSQITKRFRHERSGWAEIVGSAQISPLEVYIEEGLNERPALWAMDTSSQVKKEIWDPNPQLADVQMGEASVYRWKDPSGYAWTGGLIKPIGYVRGVRYPLVIQTHGFRTDEFFTDGSFPTAMAARALATAGIMVLQIDERRDHTVTAAEAPDQENGILAAIDQMCSEGLIDASRVGIIGFSRTAWHVEQLLVHQPRLFAAAVVADGVDMSYMQYLLFSEENPELKAEFERIDGSPPFGRQNMERWLGSAPGFSSDHIQTPLRIESHGGSSILQEWEVYSSLRLQHKPVDLIDLPTGQHLLQKPLERLASEQGVVDWFRFWLTGYESPEPLDKDEYVRWHKLRSLSKSLPIGDAPRP